MTLLCCCSTHIRLMYCTQCPLCNGYTTDRADYVEYDDNEKSSTGEEYETESEHDIGSDYEEEELEDGEETTGSVTYDNEPEPDTEKAEDTETEVDNLADKFKDWHPKTTEDDAAEKFKVLFKDVDVEKKGDTEEEKETASTAAEGEEENKLPQEILDFIKNNQEKDKNEEEATEDNTEEDTEDDKEVKPTVERQVRWFKPPGREKKHLYNRVVMPSGKRYWISVPQAEVRVWDCNGKSRLIILRPDGKLGHREHAIIAKEMERTRKQHFTGSYSGYDILKIEKVVNPHLWKQYRVSRKTIQLENHGDANEKMLFHGSTAWKSLVANGFDERYGAMSGMFGAGVYFAENSSKSNQYVFGFATGNLCPTHKIKNCMNCERVMILCRVARGRMKKYTEAANLYHAPARYHSIMGIPTPYGLRYSENVIYRGEQAYPEFLITYKLKP